MDNLNNPTRLQLSDGASARQYAMPADRSMLGNFQQRSAGLSYVEHELLRQRKTPHGKLFEQDNPVMDKHVQIPASKHVLLSSSPSLHKATSTYQEAGHTLLSQPFQNSTRHLSHQYAVDRDGHNPAPDHRSQRPAWNFPGGLDSVLNQTLPLQPSHRYYLQHGSNVPTVLPSALHTGWGPTASAGQEFYGPYWPDGTFNPYRPASIRDSRYFERGMTVQSLDRSPLSQGSNVPHLRRPGKLPTNFHESGRFHLKQASPLHNDFEVDHHGPIKSNMLGTNQVPPYRSPGYANFPVSRPFNPTPTAFNPLNQPYERVYPSLRPNLDSEQVAFRDRTFTWANRVYADLLMVIQRASKDSLGSVIGSNQARPILKPYIYPRPPKRSSSHFSDQSVHEKRNSASNSQRQTRSWHLDTNLENESRPQTAIYSPHRRASEHSKYSKESHFDATSYHLQQYAPSEHDHRRISDSTIYQATKFQNRPGIQAAATSALSTMELLCEEAKVPWVDGMLLAGCLAYGLGNYLKALSWYQTILAQDSSHVEAMSNLAATLLALNRRDEALNYWSAAVKLRPSYFEAVEHLIGLLCSNRRAKEAVDLIEFVEASLYIKPDECNGTWSDVLSDGESDTRSHASSVATMSPTERPQYDYKTDSRSSSISTTAESHDPGYGSSGYAIPGSDNGRMLALIHAKGNMLYALGNNSAAAAAFEDAILIATGQRKHGIRGLIGSILFACIRSGPNHPHTQSMLDSKDPILLAPEQAEATSRNMFPPSGELPGLEFVSEGMATKAAISTTSNSLLSLAKIYQDSMSNATEVGSLRSTSTREILALYYLSLSLQRSPSTANNVGILLAGVQQSVHLPQPETSAPAQICPVPGVVPGSGISLALLYYNYGLNLDPKHAHLYTNLGSLLKDIGQLQAAIKMYEMAVKCDGTFDIALANLANAVKDQGRVADAITYYRRAVQANPEFAEAVCGLATALNSVCSWDGRGGVYADGGLRDRIHVNDHGLMHEAARPYGWINRIVEIVEKQLKEGESWGCGTLTPSVIQDLCQQLTNRQSRGRNGVLSDLERSLRQSLQDWAGKNWEGSRIVRLIERATRLTTWQWYQDRYKSKRDYPRQLYLRPKLPPSLASPSAPTVLPFHTFTAPLSAKQVRQISQRNALRISVSTLRSAWLPATVFPPPPPPRPNLVVGYVSSDFNNHPLAHLMQSVFGLHDISRVHAICYATTSSDGSIHRQQIEREAPTFHDASSWNVERLVTQIVQDGVHILVNLNGYTRGARNEVFAARPAPIHMSFMGFAGTLGAEWCDYVFADRISVPPETLSPCRRNVDLGDRLRADALVEDAEDWVYSENIIFAKDTFFCVDHKQSAPDAAYGPPDMNSAHLRDLAWRQEQERRWKLRKQLFPSLSDTAIVLGNFNQLYKIDPATFRMYLRIMAAVPNAILWLLRFPDLGEHNLLRYAKDWAGAEIASRVIFTDVAPKGMHITRASVVDLFLDTPECNAHTTAADVVWSGTPIITWGKWKYKMCSRMAGSIVASALPDNKDGDRARQELLVQSEEHYEQEAIRLARDLRYYPGVDGRKSGGGGSGRLMEMRRTLWEGRWTSRLFDTKRWVRDLETAYWEAWKKWERGEGGDIWL